MFKNFLIVGTQRTGSTALYNALNRHPEVACGREWTLRVPWYSKISVAERALRGDFSVLAPKDRERIQEYFCEDSAWLGFKLLFRSSDKWLLHPRFSPVLWLDRLEEHLRWFARRGDIHIIHIIRCDGIEWLKSKYLSQTTGLYTNEEYPDGIKVTIPPQAAIKRLHAKDWVDTRLANLASTNPYLRVSYEDFLRSSESVLASVWEFLKCDPKKASRQAHSVQRQSKAPATEYISNYEGLMNALLSSGVLQSNLSKSEQKA
jgi:LPS sulfotransferase NodH